MRAGALGQERGEGRLAGPRRAPQDHRVELAGLERDAERAALAEQVGLAHELLEAARAHAVGKRRRPATRFAAGLLEQLHAPPHPASLYGPAPARQAGTRRRSWTTAWGTIARRRSS